MKHKPIIYSETYRGYKINCDENKGVYQDDMDRIINLIERQSQKHSKLFLDQFIINQPEDKHIENYGRKVTKTLDTVKRKLQRDAKESAHNPDIKFITAHEVSMNGKEHSHITVLANGNQIKHGGNIEKYLSKCLKKKFESNSNCIVSHAGMEGRKSMLINRNSDDYDKKMAMAIERISYLAKTRSKSDEKHARTVTCSR